MPRLPHGAVISLEAYRSALDALANCSKDVPLVFAAGQPVDLQDFDFLFPELHKDPANLLPESRETRDSLIRLGQTMRDTSPDPGAGNSEIPAAYTYFGQFVDHDITLEAVSAELPKLISPDLAPLPLSEIRDRIRNGRTATLDLDSVYGLPAPRDPNNPEKMQLGNVSAISNGSKPTLRPEGKGDDNDLPREPRSPDIMRDRAALIGDPRNDENTIIAQLHVALLKAHNALVDQGKTFNEALTTLRQHYQYIVIHDFLKRIADPQIVDYILQNGNQVYDTRGKRFFLPLEFSVAAYRFGHSMIRKDYNFNLNFNRSEEEGTTPATLGLLFTFTALSGQLGFGTDPEAGTDTLPENWIIEWEKFVDVGQPFEKARLIDTKLVEPLFELRDVLGRPDGSTGENPEPGDGARLAVRNLLRGYLLRLPTGQAVARALQQKLKGRDIPVLTSDQLIEGAGSEEQAQVLRETGFLERTPLWFYILAEASVLGKGQHLGPVGSTIVAEVLIGLVRRSEDSILSYPGWTPSLSGSDGKFTLTDLLKVAGVLSSSSPVAVGV
ncbi:peroxidase [Leptolyngbya sp. FACHB-541]|uniref:peroxidase family protein n=1 Tax=Leptolyngbya sp. FACHB-541 TaxID=2692810 RepID=UPI001687C97D|nr:heme peroxidase family protein [Leptolyngbya sp. FACHB-541]MBD1996280.1 peroxidase [Leptolyngbya sp. FACHB-541]